MKKVIFCISLFLSFSSQAVELHTGLNGPWHHPEIPGQGLVLHVIPESNQIFIAWFTYTEAGGKQMWLTAQGNLEQNPVELIIYQSTGGVFNSSLPASTLTQWGTGRIEFHSCASASFSFNGHVSGQQQLSRITTAINCLESEL